MTRLKTKLVFAFILSALIHISALFVPVFGAAIVLVSLPAGYSESTNISTSWINEEMLRIDVMDTETGDVSSIIINLRDYIEKGSDVPYIDIQAVNEEGGQLGTIRIDNPFYTMDTMGSDLGGSGGNNVQNETPVETITSPTLGSSQAQEETSQDPATAIPEHGVAESSANSGSNAGIIIFTLVVILAAAGGAVYYFMVIKRRNYYDKTEDDRESDYDGEASDYDDEISDYDENYGYTDENSDESEDDNMNENQINETKE